MFVICNSCYKEQEAQVTREPPHRVTCCFCGAKISGINDFMLRSLVERKRFASEDKGKFAFYCEKCNGVHRGCLQKTDDEQYVVCSNCKEKMENVSDFMIRMMSGIVLTDETK